MKISVITPNYNYATFIGRTIESVLMQNCDDVEHIIVDDGSTDNSVEIITAYKNKFPDKIKLIKQENRGQTPAINVGMKAATGDIICWINSDDTFCPSTFNKVLEVFKTDENVDIAFGDMNVVDLKGNFMYRRRHLKFNYGMGCLLGFTTVLSSNAVFWKKAAMDKNGLFNEALKCNMDGDFYLRLTRGMTVKKINQAFANFTKQPHTKASENNTDWDNLVKDEILLERKEAYQTLFVSHVVPFSCSFVARIPYQIIRITLRTAHGHFYKQKKELKNYFKNYRT